MRRRGRPGLIGGVARTAVVAGTASAVAGRVHHRQEQKWSQQEQDQYDQQQAAQPQYAPPPQAPEQPAYMDEIHRLASLRDQGLITNEEFEAKKRQLLGI